MKTFDDGSTVEHLDFGEKRSVEIWTNPDGSPKTVLFLKWSEREGAWVKDWSRSGGFHKVEAALFEEIAKLRRELQAKNDAARVFSAAHVSTIEDGVQVDPQAWYEFNLAFGLVKSEDGTL